jgi:ubiquinone/menaquinone biosynthesis C-methylase UbiE
VYHEEAAPDAQRQQDAVTSLFQSTVREWEDIYTRIDVYSIGYQRRRTTALALIAQAHLSPNSLILEVGCGPGLTTVALADAGYRVHAMDIVPDMVGVCRCRAERLCVLERIQFSVGDVRKLAFRGCAFDAVLVIGVTEWMASLSEVLQELERVIKPSGYLVISADNRRALQFRMNPIRSRWMAPLRRIVRSRIVPQQPRPTTYAYARREFELRLSEAGFVNLQTRQVGFGPFAFCGLGLPRALGRRLDRTLQSLADRGVKALQSAGRVYVALAQRTGHS